MYLESLLRLAQIYDHYDKQKDKIISDSFHKETEEIIKSQTDFLISELEFKRDNPGPYSFGFGDLIITLFSPDQTEVQEWAAIARKGTWQKNYRFNSIMGLIKVFSLVVEDSEKNSATE